MTWPVPGTRRLHGSLTPHRINVDSIHYRDISGVRQMGFFCKRSNGNPGSTSGHGGVHEHGAHLVGGDGHLPGHGGVDGGRVDQQRSLLHLPGGRGHTGTDVTLSHLC